MNQISIAHHPRHDEDVIVCCRITAFRHDTIGLYGFAEAEVYERV